MRPFAYHSIEYKVLEMSTIIGTAVRLASQHCHHSHVLEHECHEMTGSCWRPQHYFHYYESTLPGTSADRLEIQNDASAHDSLCWSEICDA